MYCLYNKGTPLIFSKYHLLGLFLLKLNVYIATWKLSLLFWNRQAFTFFFFKGIDFIFKSNFKFPEKLSKNYGEFPLPLLSSTPTVSPIMNILH